MSVRLKQIIAVSIGVTLGIVMILLGIWQTARYQASMEDIANERMEQPAVELAPHVHPDGSIDDIYGRRVNVTGSFVSDTHVFVGTEQPLRYVHAFELDDGRFIAVVLGETDTGEVAVESGELELTGVFTASDAAVPGEVPDDAPDGTMTSLRLQSLVQTWPKPLIAGYITLMPDDAEGFGLSPAEAVLPEQEGTEMHQGYALQWWVFAAAAVAFSIVVARGFAADERRKRTKAT